MINPFKSLLKGLKPRKPMTIVISFVTDHNGKLQTAMKVNKDIPVAYAINALDKLSFNLKQNLTNKAQAHGLSYKNSKTRSFIKSQTINDIS